MSDRGGHKNRISKEKREEIIRTFLEQGVDAAQAVAAALGLHAQYALRLVRARGLA
jgi:transposase-like protein